MLDPILNELHPVILWLVQAHNMRDPEMSKHLYVVFWAVPVPLSADTLVMFNWPHERYELSWNDPV